MSVLLPLYMAAKRGESLAEMGMKKLGGRQILVLCAFCLFSVGGQIIPKLAGQESACPGKGCPSQFCRW